MSSVIYTVAWEVPGKYEKKHLREMFDLWFRHLKGPGCYDGNITVFTNSSYYDKYDVKTIKKDVKSESDREARLGKITMSNEIKTSNNDSIMYMDLDIISVRNISRMFSRNKKMLISHSNWPVLHPKHTLKHMILNPGICFEALPSRMTKMGVSSCLFSTQSNVWSEYLRKWKILIENYETRVKEKGLNVLADQSYANVAFLTNKIPMKKYSPDLIHHKSWSLTDSVRFWHFPGIPPSDRVNKMRSMALV